MKPHKIKSIINDHTSLTRDLCKKISKDFDEDAIHDFRVSVKKLRAFLRLLNMNMPDRTFEMTSRFKHLYHIAGHIRDSQLAIKLISSRGPLLPAYMEALHNNAVRNKKEWRLHYSDKVLHKLEKKLTKENFHPLHLDVLKLFLDGQIEATYAITQAHYQDYDDIHNIRKRMKDMMYVADIAHKKWKKAEKHLDNIPEKALEEYTDVIDRFNGARFLMENMMAFAAQNIPSSEKETIQALCNDEAIRLDGEKKQILSLTKEFIASL